MGSNDFKLIDNVWGEITVEEKFIPIINSVSFRYLKDKKQLGLKSKNPRFLGAQHTRYEHSIGTYHLAKLLIQKCREKFSPYFQISETEENVFKLSALLHDIGHGPFSHSFEQVSNISHEEETFRKIEKGEIHEILVELFGDNMPSMVLKILKEKENIKRHSDFNSSSREIDFTFIIGELMSGAIDIDRLDYISRDMLNVTGERVDFRAILNGMDIDLVDGSPKIIFDYDSLNILENYFMCRFNAYNKIYFDKLSIMLDEYFVKFLKAAFEKGEITSNLSESKINYMMSAIMTDNNCNVSPYVRRYARILYTGADPQLLIKTFESLEEQEIFETAIKSLIPIEDTYYSKAKSSATIYNKQKNNVYIKHNDIVRDISEISPIIRDNIRQDTILSFLDLEILRYELTKDEKYDKSKVETTVNLIKELFESKNIEIEKKFVLDQGLDFSQEFEKICNELGAVPKGQVVNKDVYYQDVKQVLSTFKVAVRTRTYEGKNILTIKAPATDSTSLSKRQEYEYMYEEKSKEKIQEVINKILSKNSIPNIQELNEFISITTSRNKYLLNIKGSTIEISLDKSKYEGDKAAEDTMIEAELKKGNPVSLFYLTKILEERFKLINCNESKLDRAIRMTKCR